VPAAALKPAESFVGTFIPAPLPWRDEDLLPVNGRLGPILGWLNPIGSFAMYAVTRSLLAPSVGIYG
jgi:hypothetical protein